MLPLLEEISYDTVLLLGVLATHAALYSLFLGRKYDRQVRETTGRQKNGFHPHVCLVMPCTAGRTSIVIDYNADVRVCELRKPIGNLRKYDMDFQKFWISSERKNEVRSVGVDKCFCTHICFMYDSMRHSRRVMLWELPKTYLKSFFENKLKLVWLQRATSHWSHDLVLFPNHC